MKKIIMDEKSNIFQFDGKTAERLGKPETFLELWAGIIFQIGEDIYYKKDDVYTLLAKKARFYKFQIEEIEPIEQFNMLGDYFLFVENGVSGFIELPIKFAPLFEHDSHKTAEMNGKGFILISEAGHQLYKLDENYIPQLCSYSVAANENSHYFFWNGFFYSCKEKNSVEIAECQFLYEGDTYLLFEACKYVWAVFEDGKVSCLGIFKSIEETEVSDILVTEDTEYWHLGSDFIEHVVSTYYDKMEDFSDKVYVGRNGEIRRRYTMSMSRYDPLETFDEIYRLVDGHYKMAK